MKRILKEFLPIILTSLLTIVLGVLAQSYIDSSINAAYQQGGEDGMVKFSDMVIEEYGKNGSLTLDLPEKGQIKLIPEIVETNQ